MTSLYLYVTICDLLDITKKVNPMKTIVFDLNFINKTNIYHYNTKINTPKMFAMLFIVF